MFPRYEGQALGSDWTERRLLLESRKEECVSRLGWVCREGSMAFFDEGGSHGLSPAPIVR